MELNREDERPDVVMTVKDKDDINKFASNLAKRNDLREKITRNKKLIQLYDDASDEMVIMDDDAEVFYNVGDVFIMDDKSHVEVMLEKTTEDLTKDVSRCEEELETVEKEMSVLKASLYAKFGKVRSNRFHLLINSSYHTLCNFRCLLTLNFFIPIPYLVENFIQTINLEE